MTGSAHGPGCTGPDKAAALLRLASRTRELVDDLDGSRPELLSVSDLNRAIKQVLKNQVAILESLAELPAPGQDLASRVAPRPAAGAVPPASGQAPPGGGPRNGLAPSPGSRRALAGARPIAIRPRNPAPEKGKDEAPADEAEVGSWSSARAEAPAHPPHGSPTNGAAPMNGNGTAPCAPAPEVVGSVAADDRSTQGGFAPEAAPQALPQADPQANVAPAEAPPVAPGASVAEAVLQETRQVPGGLARAIVELFDNRDKDYEKGLEKLNRWVSGGAGTPFQWRGDRAYLNLNAAGATAVKNYEEQLMTRMGFSRRLGRLVVPGLLGEIVVYERPPG